MPSDRKIYCTRCKHELAAHNPKTTGRKCGGRRKDGEPCGCPKFANPNRIIVPPKDYKPREEKK